MNLARVLSDAFVDCIHDVPNALPFSKRLGLRSVPSFDLSSSCLVAGALSHACSFVFSILQCLSQKVFYGVWALRVDLSTFPICVHVIEFAC